MIRNGQIFGKIDGTRDRFHNNKQERCCTIRYFFSENDNFLHSCRMHRRKQYRNVYFHQKTQFSLDDSPNIEALQNAISGEGVLSALTWCRRHSSPMTKRTKGQKNEEYNKNNRFVRQCSIVTCPVSSTPSRSRALSTKCHGYNQM